MKKKYQDKEWLFNKYWNEELSKHRIAKLCNVGYTTIHYWMSKLNISRRTHDEAKLIKNYLELISRKSHLARANHCQLSQRAIEWFNGELLGDGCLRTKSPYSARFTYSSKYLEYCQYISNTLQSFGIKQSGKINKTHLTDRNMDCYVYSYASCYYVELLPIYKKWYLKGKKIIPKDLELTPLTLRQHYIGDGCLHHQKRVRTFITLHTNSFSILDVRWLVERLIELGFKVMRRPSDNSITISVHSTKEFLNYIGNSPASCYQYKWDY